MKSPIEMTNTCESCQTWGCDPSRCRNSNPSQWRLVKGHGLVQVCEAVAFRNGMSEDWQYIPESLALKMLNRS